MRVSWLITVVSIGVIAASLPSFLLAQRITPTEGELERQKMVATLLEGATVTAAGEEYVYLPEMRAVRSAKSSDSAEGTLAKLGIATAAVLDSKGGFVLYKVLEGTPIRSAMASAALKGTVEFPVVLNRRTGKLGIVSGSLVVKLKRMEEAEAIAATHGISLSRKYDRLGRAVFLVGQGTDMLAVEQAMADDARVESVQVEILENFNVPQ